jgi:hypothetical protein
MITAPAIFKLAVVTVEQLSACANTTEGKNIQATIGPISARAELRPLRPNIIRNPPDERARFRDILASQDPSRKHIGKKSESRRCVVSDQASSCLIAMIHGTTHTK